MNRTTQQTGMTMIETMVAMAISAVLVLGSITVYNNARGSYRTAENIARLQESMRFATDTLEEDIRLAGFWGRTNAGAKIVLEPAVQVMCGPLDVTGWALSQPGIGIDASDDAYDLACPGTNARDNSDVLVVRHASTVGANNDVGMTPDAAKVQVFTNSGGGQIFSSDVSPFPLDANENQVYDVVVSAYYVSNESKYDTVLPSLRRRRLDGTTGTTMQDQEIITGVENLQVQFGIDRNDDGQADGYVDDDHAGKRNDNIVSVRLWMLVRGDADETGQGYEDDNVYRAPDNDGFVIVPDAGNEYPRNYRRYAVTKTIKLKN